MSPAASAAAALVVAWAALVIVAQLLNPEQSPLSMGMSGLARGHAPWVMKSAFLVPRRVGAAAPDRAPGVLGTAGLTLAGIVAFWVWGVGSAALAVIDTDMPGEPPLPRRRRPRARRAGGLRRRRGRRDPAVAGAPGRERRRQPGRLGAAARADGGGRHGRRSSWRSARPRERRARRGGRGAPASQDAGHGRGRGRGRRSRAARRAVRRSRRRSPACLRSWLAAGPARATGRATRRARRRRRRPSCADLAGYAGLLQRIFVGLLMVWTLLVALGIGSR